MSYLHVVLIVLSIYFVESGHKHRTEFLFELYDRETTCFSEEFHEEFQNYTFEFHVTRGDGVQVWMTNQFNVILYSSPQQIKDIFTFFTSPGMFSFCFSNHALISLSKKIIYLRLEKTQVDLMSNAFPGPSGRGETSCDTIYSSLSKTRDLQKDYRLGMESGRSFADKLNFRLRFLTALSTFGMVLVGLGQTLYLKKMLTPTHNSSAPNVWVDMPDSSSVGNL